MTAYAIRHEISLYTETCCRCAVVFAFPDAMKGSLRRSGELFYCPNGHAQCYRETEADRLRKKLDEQTRVATQMAERARSAELAEQAAVEESRRVAKELKRVKGRSANGVCICCNRTFVDLQRHMKTKHPQEIASKTLQADK